MAIDHSAGHWLVETVKAMVGNSEPARDTTGTVTRTDPDGTVWVKLAGSTDATPCVRTSASVKPDDVVNVHVEKNRATIVGNYTSPATDDSTANDALKVGSSAKQVADQSRKMAENAISDAERAAAAAGTAEQAALEASVSARKTFSYLLDVEDDWEAIDEYREEAGETFADITQIAQDAKDAADDAETAANEAKASAYNANEYAARALGHLGTVESVAETLAWITEHGTMTLTQDIEPDPTHVYFVLDANGDYHVGNSYYSIVIEPDADDMASYYELTIDESLQNYVGTHLVLDEEGLWVLPSSSGHRVLISTGTGSLYTTPGTYIIDPNGAIVARMGEFTTIGNALSSYTSIRPDYLGMYDSGGLRYTLFGNGIYSGAVRYSTYSGRVTADANGSASIGVPGGNPTYPVGSILTVLDSDGNDVTDLWSENMILYPAGTGYQDAEGDNIRPDTGEGASFLYE